MNIPLISMRLRRRLQQVIRNPLEVIFDCLPFAVPRPAVASNDGESRPLGPPPLGSVIRNPPSFAWSPSSGVGHKESTKLRLVPLMTCYIIPPMPPIPPAGIAGASSLIFATTDSVVSNVEATLVAFWSALLVTFAGSRIPA